MKKSHKILYLAPRWLGVIFVIFISLFAANIFGESFSWLALFMHLIPSIAVLVGLIVAWRYDYVGGIIFIALGVGYILMVWGSFLWITYIVISGPAIIIGILFLLNELVLKRNKN